MPSRFEAEAWGSASMTSTRKPIIASDEATFTETLVLPTPPLVMRVTITGGRLAEPSGSECVVGGTRPAAR
ncbi:hypothetical protein D3C71_1651040 [compost metagenome]